jgi:hypothetical protein
MTKINILYPPNNYVLYGTTLNFRYEIDSLKTKDDVKSLILILDDNEIEIVYSLKKYSFENLSNGKHKLTGYFTNSKNKKITGTDFEINFNVVTNKFTPPNINWYLIKEKLPLFIQEDYKTFSRFIEAYYEWLQKSNNPLYSLYNSEFFSDIDSTPEIFLDSFRTQYLNDFPISILDDKEINLRNIIKNIRQFYSTKGTDKSFKFLFRLLYKTYVELYYPRKELLVASGNLWVERKTLRVRGINWENANFAKKSTIYQKNGSTVTSTARIIDVKCLKVNEEEIFEFEVDNINGLFSLNTSEEDLSNFNDTGKVGESAFIDLIIDSEIKTIQVFLINGINEITITTTGLYPGTFIVVEPKENYTGNSFSAIVKASNEYGIPTEITILNHGYDYRGTSNGFRFYKKEQNLLTEIYGSIKIEKLITESGYYDTVKSSPSSGGVLRDNRKYQETSYVLKSSLNPIVYIDTVKKLVHPAGIGVFSETLLKNNIKMPISEKFEIINLVSPLIGNYLPYTFNSLKNLRNDVFPNADPAAFPGGLTDLYPNGFDPVVQIPDENTATTPHEPRPFQQIKQNVNSINFTYLPQVSDITNSNKYWVVYPNPNTVSNAINNDVPIKDLKIQNFVNFSRD